MTEKKPLKTIDVKPTKTTMVKAGELIDIIEVTPLTLTDRKIYNLLIENAKQQLATPVEHCIDKEKLRQSRRGNGQVDESIMRLMSSIVKVETVREGEAAVLRMPLLGRNVEHYHKDGKFYYTFDPLLRDIIQDSNAFARLKLDVMLAFTGKYGLTLYELIEKRINLRMSEEILSIEKFRNLLGVPNGKLANWYNLKTRAIEPAVAEVNHLSKDFRVEVHGIKSGKSYTDVKIQWWRKSPDGENEAIREHLQTKMGRKARREGRVEDVFIYDQRLRAHLSDNVMEQARKILLEGNKRMGLQSAIEEWENTFRDAPKPDNPNGAFIAFCKKIA
ncbi:replication initiation protein [Sessilibacter corallicola]|uniref:Initiator Rep protein WH1 domain-containing protein n=1 Tax=Sessilibacter corallicola TaxID=2904075 RepID=A0ABQ0A9I0_9GAMM|nr:replication initiation protein [Sessilibacter corallicola]MCE2030324.1 replication initiation protein [Sessilibacter corallicola]